MGNQMDKLGRKQLFGLFRRKKLLHFIGFNTYSPV
ncbi:hypothetical protein F442_19840 [Phytophthora nicotianae P10297]|uniref:Uncharacterized protein n=2 Tax=Phytophthora nicotianae TaxID=4792 RepID=W2Y9H9_PHYNI|nr:hypothetical protein L915_19477 [Phytophthora nicotianae]ETP31273.1 hypothetical protein F442_19840 [Phytophthora nicotianae P10297]